MILSHKSSCSKNLAVLALSASKYNKSQSTIYFTLKPDKLTKVQGAPITLPKRFGLWFHNVCELYLWCMYLTMRFLELLFSPENNVFLIWYFQLYKYHSSCQEREILSRQSKTARKRKSFNIIFAAELGEKLK